MFKSTMISKLKKYKNQAGFTMIELLIVIAILGILAVAVLSAINPIEQINRGRDTGSRSDAEQLLTAVDRFNAFQGFAPWVEKVGSPRAIVVGVATECEPEDEDCTPNPGGMQAVGGGWMATNITDCKVLDRLASGGMTTGENPTPIAGCAGTEELKNSFTNRISGTNYNTLFIYDRGQSGDSTYVCFVPQSKAFRTEAETRCEDVTGLGLPEDLRDIGDTICGGYGGADPVYSCLP